MNEESSVARHPCPASPEGLRALLQRDEPLILTGLGDGLPAFALWRDVDYVAALGGDVAFRVIRTDPALDVPGAGTEVPMTLRQLLEGLRRPLDPGGVRHYLAGANLLEHEQQLGQALAECENFYKTTVVKTTIGALGMWLGRDGQRTWLHFDCANNFLLQIKGSKRFVLAPPDAYPNLYCYTFSSCRGKDMDGEMYRFSEVNAWQPDLERHPRAARVKFRTATIVAGETLLIPLGWFHAVVSSGDPDMNVALNLFFDAEPEEWERRKYLKSFRQVYSGGKK